MSLVETPDPAIVDELDGGIIHCLQLNARASFRLIADVLDVSEQTVARRYRRMRADGVVRVVTRVSPWSFGESSYLVRLHARPESVRALARALADRDDVAWVTIGSGGTDIVAALHSRSAADREHLLLERLPRTAQVLSFTVHSLMHRFVPAGGVDWTVQSPLVSADVERAMVAGRPVAQPRALARVMPEDEPMLAVLALDGRRSIADLAQQTRWSAARVTRRLEALLGSGAVYLDVDIAHSALGFAPPVDIWLTVEPAQLHTAGQALAQLPEIAFCAAITGTANLVAVSHFRTSAELYGFVTARIGALPGIRQFELSPVMQIVKQAGSFVEAGRLTGTPTVRRRAASA